MSIEAMKQAADTLERYALQHGNPDDMSDAITALRTAIAQPAPVQVSPTDFVDMVMDKEDAIGKPIFWAEWPNRERNHD